jgi:hypothetical protein
MVWSFTTMSLIAFVRSKGLFGIKLWSTLLNKMVLQKRLIGHYLKGLGACFRMRIWIRSFGRKPLTSLAIWWIDLLPPRLNWRHPKKYGRKLADYSNLRVFGCPAYSHMNEGKLEPRSKKCVFVGYSENVKGYKLWCPNHLSFLSLEILFSMSR